MAAAVALALTGVTVPPAVAWTYPEPAGEVWTPPNTPLGSAGASVKGHDAQPPSATAPGKAADWKPEAAAPVVTGAATVVVGADSAEAEAARKATGGASPASGGKTGSKAGNLAVRVAPGTGAGESAHTVTVEVAGPDKGKAAGVSGPLITVKDADAPTGGNGREARVTLDLKALQAGGWSDRAALVALPACSLTTPERPECRTQTPVTAKTDSTGTITADIALPPAAAPDSSHNGTVKASYTTASDSTATSGDTGTTGGPVVLSPTPAPAGPLGNYTATSLSPSAAWTAGSNTGGFAYNYPIEVPPALAGGSPVVALGYNSADVDGKTSASNAQPSWIGDGWGYEPGYIERSYRSCDKAGITGSTDLCWGGQNATLSLSGHSGAIVRDDDTGTWHLAIDDGSKIEQLTGALKTAGDIDYQGMEYWRITTPDGVQYYFGLNHLPGGDGSDPAVNSVLTVPVYSPNSGDPCYNPGSGKNSWCQMAWRWQLDYVIDPHGNLTTYKYATEGNKYNRGRVQSGANGILTDYQRSGYLKEIAYGQRLDEQKAAKGGATPAARVVFTVAERCTPNGAITCSENQRTTANADAWPDTPIDQICTDSSCVNAAPTFFTTKRLTTISTQISVGAETRTVDTWNLNQRLADPGDGTKRLLQLDSVQRVPSNGQAEIKDLPAVQFQYVMRANRIDGLVPAEKMYMRPRLTGVTTETGGRINVIYADPQCSRVNNRMPASEDGNTMACMPVKWYPDFWSSKEPVNDWFDKPLVKVVTEQDLVSTPAVSKTTEYTYNGAAAWHRNDSEFTDPKVRTWDQFRGYQSVTTTTGDASPGEAPKTQQTVTYLRGMNDDYLADGKTRRTVQVPSPLGGTLTDSAQLFGRTVATEIYDQAGGTVTAISGSTYNGQQASATHSQTAGVPKIYAWRPDSETTSIAKTKLADGSWRTTTAVTTTEPANGNRTVKVDDKGDGTAATPEICTTTSYAASDNPQLLSLTSEKTTYQGSCSTAATASNTLTGSRILYDGKALKKAGAVGDATSGQTLDHFDQSGNPVYVHGGTGTFDVYGRPLTTATTDGSTYDRDGVQLTGPSVTPAVTSIAITPASGQLPTEIRTTGPMGAGWTTTVTQDPARGTPLTSKDINDRVTTAQYDALGRLTAVWAPDRPTTELPSRKFTYSLNGTSAPSAIKTESINDDALSYSASIDIFDGLARPRQTQSTSAAKPTGRLIAENVYDSHGWVIKTSAPYYEKGSFPTESVFIPVADGQIPGQTWNTYDGAGRVVRSEFRSNGNLQWATTTAYPGADRVDVTPAPGAAPSSTVTDARGRTSALWQYRTPTPTGNPTDADVTTYNYAPSGLVASRTDSSGNSWSYGYDLRGRQTSAFDPDTGATRTYYDVNSRVDHTVDAKNNTLAYSYDLLGRKTGLYNGSVTPANQLASWTYDTILKGRPTSSTRYVGGAGGAAYTTAVTDYDTSYRPLGTSITIPPVEKELAGTYTTTNTYSDVIGSLTKVSIPAAGGLPAETVSYGRTITGLLTSATSRSKSVITKVEYDALARPVRTTAGEYGKQVVSTQQYDWATGRVINNFLDRQTSTVSVDQTSYTYTPSGRITSITDIQDAAATDTQCFTYDHLSRLTGAWTDTGGTATTADWTDSSGTVHGTGSSTTVPGIGACTNKDGPATVSPGGRTVGGPAPYWNTYTYDATGNRTGYVQHDITGNSLNDTTTTQTFGAAKNTNTPTTAANTGGGTGGPHALLTSTTSGPAGTRAIGYQYDAKGNTTAITDTGGTTTLTWNGEDKLDSLTKTGQAGATTYLYDADGNQLIRRNPGKTTLNLPTDELTLDTASGSTSNVRSISGPGGLTYTRVTAAIGGGTVLIQAADPHGTNGVQINTDTAQSVTRRPTDPFGNPRGTQPTANQWAGTKGFVGGTKDDTTGLTNLGARQYDPLRGRFINPDPILDEADPQQWNGYAYSNNNPVNLSDPSGLRPDGTCGGFGSCNDPEGNPVKETWTSDHGVWSVEVEKTVYAGTKGYSSNDCRHDNSCAVTLADRTMSAFLRTAKMSKKQDIVRNSSNTSEAEINRVLKKYNFGFSGIDWAALQMWEYGASEEEADYFRANYCLYIDCSLESQIENGIATGGARGLVTPFGPSPTERAGDAVAASMMALAARGGVGKPGELEGLSAGSRARLCQSFVAGTLVVMADGQHKPIEQVQVGDEVLATDPQTGETSHKAVTVVTETPNDEDFTDLSFQSAQVTELPNASGESTLTTTWHHPFWSITNGRWVEASELQVGEELRAPEGAAVAIAGIRNYHRQVLTYNFTVSDFHTYYALAGNRPVLVHNDSYPCKIGSNGWPIPNMNNCMACAKIIQKKIGGVIYHVKDSLGSPVLGPSTHDPHGRWDEHFVVIKEGVAYDGFTGAKGMPLEQYRKQWKYGEYLDFTPWGGE
ncbi:polymorphic toxin-type HINT domain-containing protein [Kitasatospora sp. NPDC059577]|uniref:polymorphic toxin-type HINT domain-containing protein n=1 Tax=Kitasatospora sp. NPDC059577 TaxID=3346873 RepID=UPI0036830808